MTRSISTVCKLCLFVVAFSCPAFAQTLSQADIGDVGQPGSFTAGDGTVNVKGAGSDIWGTADSFHYVYTQLDGDGDVYALVGSESATNPFAKGGIMIRGSLDPSSWHFILDVKPDGGIELMTRDVNGGTTRFITGSKTSLPVWLRLARRGSSIGAFVATSAQCDPLNDTCSNWTLLTGDFLTPFSSEEAGPALIGFAVTSHDPSTLNEVPFEFIHVAILPSPWHEVEFASDAPPASTEPDGQGGTTFLVPAAGRDIWSTSDSFAFVYQVFRGGDASVVARVTADPGSNPFAKAGVMMRGGLLDSSKSVVLDVKPDGGVEFMARKTDGGQTDFIAGGFMPHPTWLKLERHGDEFDGFESNDGVSWSLVGVVSFSGMSSDEYFPGLAATSHDPNVSGIASFDHVSVTPLAGGGVNMLVNGGFEDDIPPALNTGWKSDPIRQNPAVSETAHARSGIKNGACSSTPTGDCGMYQDVTIQTTGRYFFTAYFATGGNPDAIQGLNINGNFYGGGNIGDGPTYGQHLTGFSANAGDVVRVWVYVFRGGGAVFIDDTSITPAFQTQ